MTACKIRSIQTRANRICNGPMSENKNELPCRLLDRGAVLELVPVSYPTLWKWMRTGRFPRALQIGEQKLAWREDEVQNWIETRPRQELKGIVEGSEQIDD